MTTTIPAETRTVIENVRWETYVALADDRRGSVPRMTYEHGRLELMSPEKEHEKIKSLLGRLIHASCDEREIEVESVASTTFRRQDLARGFEADESFYIANAEAIRAKEDIDLTQDPPPDLVVEVEITSPLIARLELFAAMEVPEVWRHDGTSLGLFRLQGSGYESTQESLQLPGFPASLAEDFLSQRFARGETELVRQFRQSLS